MKTIQRFQIGLLSNKEIVYMPKGAKIIYVDAYDGIPFIWAITDPEAEMVPFTFYFRAEGQPFTGQEGEHIASFQIEGDVRVFHLFAAKEA